MNRLFTFLFLFSFLLLVSCKDEDCCQEVIVNEIFLELGHDRPYTNGSVYYGRNKYVEYYPGNLPIILSVPHGGNMMPDEINDRTYGTNVNDVNLFLCKTKISTPLKNGFRFSTGVSLPHRVIILLLS